METCKVSALDHSKSQKYQNYQNVCSCLDSPEDEIRVTLFIYRDNWKTQVFISPLTKKKKKGKKSKSKVLFLSL